MHTWLPDAHSQAPAPVSALMSGVLLSVAFYAILRVKVIADAALGPGFAARAARSSPALLSLAVAASLLLAQRDYKRLLAYSSIEHMGIIALGAAIGTPLADRRRAAAHARSRPRQERRCSSAPGEILPRPRAPPTSAASAAWPRRRPLLGGTFGLGLLGLLGLPPFALFASELAHRSRRLRRRARLGHGRRRWCSCSSSSPRSLAHAGDMLLGAAARDRRAATTDRCGVADRRGPLIAGLAAVRRRSASPIWPLERLLHAAAARRRRT